MNIKLDIECRSVYNNNYYNKKGNNKMTNQITLQNGITLLNGTPHQITLQVDEESIVLQPTMLGNGNTLANKLGAIPTEKVVNIINGIEFVNTVFFTSEEGEQWINDHIEPNTLILGSIISAQAYGLPIVAMVSVPGFERKPPAEKLMRTDKFTVYQV